MSHKQKIYTVFALFLIFACLIPTIVSAGMFESFMRGQRQANEDNWRDAQQYQQNMQQIQQIINSDIMYFNKTGDYGALCHAASFGSVDATNYLRQNKVACNQQR